MGSTLHWEKVESSLIKLKSVEFNQCNDRIFNLLANNLLSFDLNSKFVAESLFTQLMVLTIANVGLSDICHLQIILNGCINIKYLSLCNIHLCASSDQIHKLYQKEHSMDSGGGGYYSNDDDSRFSDRIQRRKTMKQQKKQTMEYMDNVPIIYVPKSVKYFKIYHRFKSFYQTTEIYDDTFCEADEDEIDDEEESKYSSTHSTPLLFAMDDMTQKSPKRSVKNKSNKKQNHKMQSLALPPFYCNLSKCHKQLIEANVVLNDPYLLNQLIEHQMSCLKYVILSYCSSEHNRYLSLNEFCSFYAHLYRNWNESNSKNVQLVLNNSLYDGWRYSVNKAQITQFFENIFNKKEHQIMSEQQLYFGVDRFAKNKSLENLFIDKLSKCTDFFESQVVNHLF